MIAAVDGLAVEGWFQQRAVNHAHGNAGCDRERLKQRMEIRAVAGFVGKAILGAAGRGRFQVVGILHPVINILQRPVVDFACGQDRIAFAVSP